MAVTVYDDHLFVSGRIPARKLRTEADRTRCRKMGNAARAYVANRHSLEVRVRELEDLLAG
jgi:hypothetical protein